MTNREIFLSYIAQTSSTPLMLEIDIAEGLYLTDVHGKKYMDMISGISVSSVGHRHPRVIEAIQKQLEKYLHVMVYGEYILSPQVMLANALRNTLPASLNNIYFVNSGSEAVEGALKLAKRYTGRHEIVSFENAYHGSTHGSLSVTGNENFKNAFRPLLPGIVHIKFNSYEDLKKITLHTAAVIIELVQGEAGVRIADKNYMKALKNTCEKTGTLLIVDEIQTGFGRTGSFWCFEQYDIIPDILVTAKAMGGGLPLGTFISSKEIMNHLTHHPVLGHITTYGGNPVCCAASLATLQVILNENLIAGVQTKEKLFHEYLIHPKIKQIRSKGLLIAVEFESYRELKPIIDRCIHKGVITDWFLFCDNSMRLAPPLTITNTEIKKACEIITSCI